MTRADILTAAILLPLGLVFSIGFIYATAHTLAGPAGIATALAFTAYYLWGRYAHRND
ncbi:hypothetical protein [Corynebacterium sp.]|uniref:hypothetical protein n=1 Tax=Corynebacterium sp. TaxID=1720 RepID=UPI0028B15A95|nr:hypothetical protein [Corynebacterium sp.]